MSQRPWVGCVWVSASAAVVMTLAVSVSWGAEPAAVPKNNVSSQPDAPAEAPTVPPQPIVAVVPASPTPAVLARREGEELRKAVRQALIQIAGKKQQVSESDVRELLGMYAEVQRDTKLSRSEREKLRIEVRWRLLQVSEKLQKRELRLQPAAKEAVPEIVQAPPQGTTLAQQQLPPAFGAAGQGMAPPNPPADENYGRELVELIQDTVAPSTWDSRGGQGVIRYWPLGHAIVVRQTEDAHHDMAELLEALRH
jgi:hypothetical protein